MPKNDWGTGNKQNSEEGTREQAVSCQGSDLVKFLRRVD